MRFQFLTVGAAVMLMSACSSDPEPEPDCAVGEQCPCVTTADCPDPVAEQCQAFTDICVPVATGDVAVDSDDTTADAGDATVEDVQDTTLADTADDAADDIESDGSGQDPDVISTDLGDTFVDEGGLCANPSDISAIGGDDDPRRDCTLSCSDQGDNFESCVGTCYDALSLSTGCYDCHVTFSTCATNGCLDDCATGQDECLACVSPNLEAGCSDAYNTCAGAWSVLPDGDACVNSGDQSRVDAEDPRAASRECAAGCDDGDVDCVTSCIVSDIELTQECSECFAQQAGNCDEANSCDCSDPDSETCTECLDTACLDQLIACSGLFDPADDQTNIVLTHLSGDVADVIAYRADDNTEITDVVNFGEIDFSTVSVFNADVLIRGATDGPDTRPLATGEFDAPFVRDGLTYVSLIGRQLSTPPSLTVVRIDAETSEIDSGASLRFVNGIPATTVSLWDVSNPDSPSSLVGGAEFGAVSSSFAVPAEVLAVGVDMDEDDVVDATFALTATPEGEHAIVWLTQDGGEQPIMFGTFADGHIEDWPAQP